MPQVPIFTGMIFSLTSREREELRTLQRKNRDKKIYIRVTVLLMLDSGFSREQIASALGIDPSTISRYKDKFRQSKDLEAYLSDNYLAYSGKMTKKEEAILAKELEDNFYRTTYEIAEYIEKHFKKSYSPTGLAPLLHRLGFTYKKTSLEPGKANIDEQQSFARQMVKDIIEQPTDEASYFIDGVHPQHNTRAEYGWVKKGEQKTIKANTGRKRVNINGALNPDDPTDVQIDITESVNAQSTIRLLEKIKLKNKGKKRIIIYSDNAKYYKSSVLKGYLKKNKQFEFRHLPPYSPNLNLIERLWKFLKKKVINSHYYEKYEAFKAAIIRFFKNIKQHKIELQSLLTLNFQILGQ